MSVDRERCEREVERVKDYLRQVFLKFVKHHVTHVRNQAALMAQESSRMQNNASTCATLIEVDDGL